LHQALLYQHPYEVIISIARSCQPLIGAANNEGNIPLHEAVYHHASVDTIRFLIDQHPATIAAEQEGNDQPLTHGGLKAANKWGWLPLHYACGHGKQTLEVVLIIYHL
jgi:ankyrin repeat protein